jgi:hypothetical protein
MRTTPTEFLVLRNVTSVYWGFEVKLHHELLTAEIRKILFLLACLMSGIMKNWQTLDKPVRC